MKVLIKRYKFVINIFIFTLSFACFFSSNLSFKNIGATLNAANIAVEPQNNSQINSKIYWPFQNAVELENLYWAKKCENSSCTEFKLRADFSENCNAEFCDLMTWSRKKSIKNLKYEVKEQKTRFNSIDIENAQDFVTLITLPNGFNGVFLSDICFAYCNGGQFIWYKNGFRNEIKSDLLFTPNIQTLSELQKTIKSIERNY